MASDGKMMYNAHIGETAGGRRGEPDGKNQETACDAGKEKMEWTDSADPAVYCTVYFLYSGSHGEFGSGTT